MPRQACLLLACALACAAGYAHEYDDAAEGFGPILLVVGDVTASSGRIVFDLLEKTLQGSRVSVTIFEHETDKLVENGEDIVFDSSVRLAAFPKVWLIRGLPSNTAFRVEFAVEDDARPPSMAFFRTFPASDSFPFRFFSISCNRADEDHDDDFAEQLHNTDPESWKPMVHMGDQIYADAITNAWEKDGRKQGQEQLLEEFRDTYRRTWSRPMIRSLLSHGPNWQLPDDHEFTSNVDADHLNKSSKFERRTLALAGRQAFLEYQVQLQRDVFDDAHQIIPSEDRAYFSRRIGSIVLMFIDTRYQRSFHFEPESPYLGTQQWQAIRSSMKSFGDDESVKHIFVISSIPLMFTTTPLANLAFFVEREKFSSHPDLTEENEKLLDLLVKYAKKTSIIAGDVHLFLHARLCRNKSSDQCLEQWVTSGISPGSTIAMHMIGWMFHFLSIYASSRTVANWSFTPIQSFTGPNALAIEVANNTVRFDAILQLNRSQRLQWADWAFSGLGSLIIDVHPYALSAAFTSTFFVIAASVYFSRRTPS